MWRVSREGGKSNNDGEIDNNDKNNIMETYLLNKYETKYLLNIYLVHWASQVVLVVKNRPSSAGDTEDEGLIPGLGRTLGVGNGNQFQHFCLENSMDRAARRLQSMRSQRVRHD